MRFTDALCGGVLGEIQKAPKSDLHNHAGRGGTIEYISKWVGKPIAPPAGTFADLSAMQAWFEANIKSCCPGLAGYLKRLEAAFVQAASDGIIALSMSFAKGEIDALGGMDAFVSTINALHRRHAPGVCFYPELALGRGDDPGLILTWLDEILSPGWFASIDICNDELAQPIRNFKRVYALSERYGVKRRAHAGEFGSADDVMEAVETLRLHEVHHGIAAASSPQIMKWLCGHGVQLNICPASNIMLRRAESYRAHPISTLFRNGVPVTINTDDLLIFGSSVSQEYLRLYKAGALTAGELERIRETGLASAGRR